ncbi:WD40/YVTN/BNR-like repeat-containing protein [Marinospirillum minutulum]|uniref:WD40/YVTN/BNR-like repeat-containing protein n=1 Tax=Marinospirillum minutulum TaxID=64974 RepID=UPI0004251E33|nr:hypothetical protein [Marinospirillum minutulum]
MSHSTESAPTNPARRNLFRKIAAAADPNSPRQAVWRRVAQVGAGEGDVLWSGWAADDEIFVVGDEGVVLHFDASSTSQEGLWLNMQTPTQLPLHSIWGRNSKELHAVGWMGTVLSFDGKEWHHRRGGLIDPETQGFVACSENNPLFAITGDEKGRAWAVGDNGTLLAFDGKEWQQEQSPTRLNLRGITLTPKGQLFAVGAEGTVITSKGDGQWEKLDCPIGAGFIAVLALADDELLLAGGRYFVDAGGFRGELVRWHKGEFTKIETTQEIPRLRALRTYKKGVLIAGDQGHLFYLEGERLSQLRTDTHHDLMDIIPLPSGEALAVGDFSTIMTAAANFSEALAPKKTAQQVQPIWELMESGTEHNLWGLHALADGRVFACGDSGTVLEYKSQQWQSLPKANSELSVHCLWTDYQGGIYAGCAMGQIYHYDGKTWELAFNLNLDITILSMWGSGPDSIYAVGDEGLILHWNGLIWHRMISGTKTTLYSIWGYDDKHLLTVGDFGLVLRWNGENWAEFYAGTENFLFDVWGDALDNIFIVGLSGTLVHFNGEKWNLTPIRARDDLMALDGLSNNCIYAVGTHGSILRFDGQQWLSETTPNASLRAICVLTDTSVFAVGNQGVILKRNA